LKIVKNSLKPKTTAAPTLTKSTHQSSPYVYIQIEMKTIIFHRIHGNVKTNFVSVGHNLNQ